MPDPRAYRAGLEPNELARRRAKELRRELTPPEKRLWFAIKSKKLEGLHFRVQHPVGAYIADFYCHAARLIVEVDGGQHRGDQLGHDRQRDDWLRSHGVRVLRIQARDVRDHLEGVLGMILRVARGCLEERGREKEQGI